MMKKIFRAFIFPVILLNAYACQKIESLSPVPYIEYRSFEVFDTIGLLGNKDKAGRLKFYFEDGDGDIGLEPSTGEQTDSNNFFITAFTKKNGIMVQVPEDPTNPEYSKYYISSFRIPYMEREGQNKILKGTIEIFIIFNLYSPNDTLKYDFYILDRALNASNIVSTNEIILGRNNTY